MHVLEFSAWIFFFVIMWCFHIYSLSCELMHYCMIEPSIKFPIYSFVLMLYTIISNMILLWILLYHLRRQLCFHFCRSHWYHLVHSHWCFYACLHTLLIHIQCVNIVDKTSLLKLWATIVWQCIGCISLTVSGRYRIRRLFDSVMLLVRVRTLIEACTCNCCITVVGINITLQCTLWTAWFVEVSASHLSVVSLWVMLGVLVS